MFLSEIIKKLHLVEIKTYLQICLKLDHHPTKITINQLIINIVDNLTPKQFEEVRAKSLEVAGEIETRTGLKETNYGTLAGKIDLEKGKETTSKLPQSLKEAIAKAIIIGTIITNLSTLRQKLPKDLININSNINVILLIACDKCGKFFNSGIGGNLRSLISSFFINNTHQCQYCGNMQLAKDNSDYFALLQ